ncbi:hypothetical protein E0E54_18335 [Azotobacter chroococcum]|uniref:hypothetical protein n=1 Tax=Azotobacter chroococcum TaxID=353 RepID=UPI00103D0963|nr:hypothetical protein [Azotobacter chroococcum]TBW32783.1 hypothetical protein E0E54_18335 [Azotobacter chroococcum]
MPNLIESVAAPGAPVQPGEPVDIAVTLRADAQDAVVSIAGIRGATHTLQAPARAGEWRVAILAGRPGEEAERQTISLTVAASDKVVPRLGMERDPFQPYAVILSFPQDQFAHGATFSWAVGAVTAVTSEPVFYANLASEVDDTRLLTSIPVEVEVRFVDGSVSKPRRTISLWSLYQIIRETGRVSPPIRTTGIATRRLRDPGAGNVQPGPFRGEFSIRNLEPEELRITSLRKRWTGGDDGGAEAVDIRVPAGGSATHEIELAPADEAGKSDACVVSLSGEVGDMPVLAEVAFDLRTVHAKSDFRFDPPPKYRKPWPWEREDWGIDDFRKVNPRLVVDDRLTAQGAWVLGRMGQIQEWARLAAVQPGAAQPVQRGRPQVGGIHIQPRVAGPLAARRQSTRAGLLSQATRISAARQLAAAKLDLARPFKAVVSPAGIKFTDIFAEKRRGVEVMFDVGGGVAPGNPCDPDNLPADIPPGMACQFSGEFVEKILPDRVMNAKKGDVFLSPGGSGVIGGLLRQVTPPQRYAHSGIFTRDRVEVAHSTAAEGWLEAQHSGGLWSPPFGNEPAPSDGFDPAALKYIWPGGVIQSAEEAVGGSGFQGPDGKEYRLTAFGRDGFAQIGDNWEVVPAVLVKPDPLKDTPEVRAKLHAVADAARAMSVTGDDTRQGKRSQRHYRFFCYTDASISDPVPADAGWAVGTLPSVCSQFVWDSARIAGVATFEGGALEPDDAKPGIAVEIQPGIPDGLYHYTSQERADAAEWLHDFYVEKVSAAIEERTGGDVIGGIWNFFSDISDDVANQIINAFAHDWTDKEAKDSTRWRDEPRDGTAVSPDDIMRWDGPDRGGFWGVTVPMDYRPRRPELVPTYVWRQTAGPGTLSGLITYQGNPAPGADVKVGGKTLNADGAGRFTIQLFEGPYVVEAGLHVDGVGYVEAKVPVTVEFNKTVDATIALKDPPDVYRRVVIRGSGKIRDAEDFDDDEVEDVGVNLTFDVQPFRSHGEQLWSQGVGDEVLVDLMVTVDLEFDRSVTVRVKGKFYESDDEERTDLEMEQNWEWNVAPGQQRVESIHLWNKDEDEPGDNFDVALVMTNDRQP